MITSLKKSISSLSLRLKIFSGFFVIFLLISVFIFTYYPYIEKKYLYKVMNNKYQSTAEMIALGVGVGMESNNFKVITASIDWAKKDPDLHLIIALDKNKEVFGMYNPLKIESIEPYLAINDSIVKIEGQSFFILKVPILYNNIDYGTITTVTSLERHFSLIHKNSIASLFISLILFIVAISISFFFIKSITRPLLYLRDASEKIAKGNYDIVIHTKSNDEIGDLAKSFNEMTAKMKLFVNNLKKEIATSKQAEDAMRKSEVKFRKIAENVVEGVCITQFNKIHWANPAFLDIFGYSHEELYNNKTDSLIIPEDTSKLFNFFELHLNNRDTNPYFDTIGIKKNKEMIFISIAAGKIIYEDKPAILMVIHDITLHVNSEKKLRELIATKDKFFSIIAHDLKSPFNSLIGFSEMLIEKSNSLSETELTNMYRHIYNTSTTTFNLLENLLEWSRSQSGLIVLTLENHKINDIVNECISILASTAKKKGINILVEVEDKDMVYADKDTINTVIRNLISNAIKYTQKDGTITITSVNLKDRVQISISDTGIGISLENMEKIFMIEHTISTLGTDNEKGTGLGLMLCKDFIEKHNGKIWVESEVEKGSVFHFTLPKKKENKQS